MVYYSSAPLDRTFAALADPTRRALLARLSESDSLSVSELAEPFAMSLPAVMKHLDVLSDAGLVTRNKTGRTVTCRLTRGRRCKKPMNWLNRYQRFWTEQLDRLAAFLEEDIMATATAVKPSLTIKRRFNAPPAKVFAAWTDPEKVKRWMGPGEVKALSAETDPRIGGRYRMADASAGRRGARRQRRLSRGRAEREAGLHLGLEDARRSASRWSPLTFKPDGDGTLLTLTHEQFFDEDGARPPQPGLDRRDRQARKVSRR